MAKNLVGRGVSWVLPLNPRVAIPVLALACLLSGCTTSQAPVVLPNVSGNWQIQTTDAAPNIGVILLGSLSVQGTSATGTFRFADLASGNPCGTTFQTLNFSGSIDPTNNLLTLTSEPFGIGGSTFQVYLGLSPTTHNQNDGNVVITGTDCTYPSSPAVGVQVAALAGTYQGAIGIPGSLPGSGQATASLNVTQAATANADGQYAVNGSLAFAGVGCTETVPVSGTVSGENLNLASNPSASGASDFSISAAPKADASQLNSVRIEVNSGTCYSAVPAYDTYAGTLAQ